MVGVPGVIRTHAANSWGHLDPNQKLLPRLFQEAGYHTAVVGKWHLGLEAPNIPNKRGFDYFHGFLGDMMDDYYTHQRHGNDYMYHNETLIHPKGHATDLFTDWACNYVRDRKATANKPWFLYLAYNAPHTPIQPPVEWLDKVKERHLNAEQNDVVQVSFKVLDPLREPASYRYTKADVERVVKRRKAIDGRRIRIEGSMFPSYQVSELRQFALCEAVPVMALVRAMSPVELIPVSLSPGRTTDYIDNRPFHVEGTLRIDPVYEEGHAVQLYRIDDARIVGESRIDERRSKLVALIEHMDHGIGKVLKTLEETGQQENTIVVFTSDNGGQINVGANNGPLRDGKQSVYEGGLKVPTCVVLAGNSPAKRRDQLSGDVDGYPANPDGHRQH